MQKELYVVCFESMNYAGAGETCMAWATSEEEAMEVAAQHAEEFYYEQDQEQYVEENGDDEDVMWATVTSAELLKGSRYEEFQKDPSQSSFYQIVN